MKGERVRNKKPENLDTENEEQHSRGQWNATENGSAQMKMGTRAGNPMMSCLPRTASLLSASYPIAPFSPGKDIKRPADYGARGRMASCQARGHSGPIISIIPKEVRGKKKDSGFESQEPTSPKVSCIGQVKLKKKTCKANAKAKAKENNKDQIGDQPVLRTKENGSEPKTMKLKKFFSISRKKKPERPVSDSESTEEDAVPSLGQLKRFSSGRDQGALLVNIFENSRRGDSRCSPTAEDSSDEDNGDGRRSVWDNKEVKNPKNENRNKKNSPVLISHSGPLLSEPLPKPATSNGQPSEVNLWKRRSVDPPMALDLKRSYALETRQPTTA